jgi:hypothetical protein
VTLKRPRPDGNAPPLRILEHHAIQRLQTHGPVHHASLAQATWSRASQTRLSQNAGWVARCRAPLRRCGSNQLGRAAGQSAGVGRLVGDHEISIGSSGAVEHVLGEAIGNSRIEAEEQFWFDQLEFHQLVVGRIARDVNARVRGCCVERIQR